ncbi:MAG: MBL fold metallo-hydrolase [Methanobacteriota archaeon]
MAHERVEGSKVAYTIDTDGFKAKRYCAAYLLATKPAAFLDCGPSTTVDRLLSTLDAVGVARTDVGYVFATHIHLDHAGACGHLLRELPNAKLVVHESAVPHVVDPARLLASTERAVGAMWPMYGTLLPCPADRVVPVKGGESFPLSDGRRIEVTYTPGHAPHHVVYYEPTERLLAAGDAAGMYLPDADEIIVTTTPPAFHLETWLSSLDALERIPAKRLLLTHFGPRAPEPHLAEHRRLLREFVNDVESAWTEHHKDDEPTIETVTDLYAHWEPAYGETFEPTLRMDVQGVIIYLRRRLEGKA